MVCILLNKGELQSQWVHVAVWYLSGPSSTFYVLTVGPMYVLYRYVDPLGVEARRLVHHDGPPNRNRRRKDKQYKSSYIHVPTSYGLL